MKEITVLMSTYNGEKYILEQLKSLEKQKGVLINLFIRDDGSTDNTVNIIKEYKTDKIKIKLICGENIGVRDSSVWLIKNCQYKTEYYAFCDQDDYWLEENLISAIKIMDKDKEKIPKLYYSNIFVTDENLNIITKSNYNKVKDTLPVALANNPATGCTVVFNRELLEKVVFPENYKIRMHDWWMYKVCICIGGKIYKDKNSYIYYRQHGNNAVGAIRKKSIIKQIYDFSKKISYFSKEAELLKKDHLNLIMDKRKLKKIEKVEKLAKLGLLKRIKILFDKDFDIGILKYTMQLKIAILIHKNKGGNNEQ